MYQHSMKQFQIFRINPFTSQFYAKNFTVKTLRSAPKRPLKITKFSQIEPIAQPYGD